MGVPERGPHLSDLCRQARHLPRIHHHLKWAPQILYEDVILRHRCKGRVIRRRERVDATTPWIGTPFPQANGREALDRALRVQLSLGRHGDDQ